MMKTNYEASPLRTISICLAAALAAAGVYWFYYMQAEQVRLSEMSSSFASTTRAFASIISEQRVKITQLSEENSALNGSLTSEQRRRLELENVKAMNDKQIDTLTKLTTIDPELLKKYSKVFFLSENYVPPRLKDVDQSYLADAEKPAQVLENMYPFLVDMTNAAKNSGVPLLVISGYRSFEYQKNLKSDYKIIYGAGTANQFSAEQGYSEHQMGTAIDFGTTKSLTAEVTFEKTDAFKWLNDNAYKYGFVISYPKANKFYQYEPWHWRFVGKELALSLQERKMYFYEDDQRDIDSYLIKIFDR